MSLHPQAFCAVPQETVSVARAAYQGFAVTHFTIDWQQRQVTCPLGKASHLWINTHDRHGKDVIHSKFDPADCQACPCRTLCTKAISGARMLTLRPQQQHSLALRDLHGSDKPPRLSKRNTLDAPE